PSRTRDRRTGRTVSCAGISRRHLLATTRRIGKDRQGYRLAVRWLDQKVAGLVKAQQPADHAVDRYVFAQLASPIEPEFGDLTEALLLPPVHPEEEMATERLDQIGARDPAAAFLLERGVLVVEPRITHRQVIANC